jgi:CRP-like cAMP-binding protein
VITKLIILEDGSSAEVGMVGREGMTGLCVFLGVAKSPIRAVVQVSGPALRMKAGLLLKELRRGDNLLQKLLLQYTSGFLVQVSHLAACNQRHSVKQRCCRLLLSTFDRVESDEMLFTQDSLARFLGVRRASVGEVMSELKAAGALNYARGRIMLLDHRWLESCACECYRHIRDINNGMIAGKA